ncbi:MAG: hypothetical protein ACMUEM_00340 [Flavobacteriales bacterium AspAUS03]
MNNFLSSSHKAYESIPESIQRNMDRSQLLPNISWAINQKKVPYDEQDRTFLNALIHQEKILLLTDTLLIKDSGSDKIDYTYQKIDWFRSNGPELWKHWFENRLLFSKYNKLYNRFITPGPFSKFYTEIDRNPLGRIGI